MKKIILVILMFLTTACNANSSEFRFEDYKSQDKFEAKIKKMFPIGGNFEDLKGQLPGEWGSDVGANKVSINHSAKRWWLFGGHYWTVKITLDEKSKKILGIKPKYMRFLK